MHVEQVHDQQVARSGALDRDRAAEDVDAGQPDVTDVVGGVVVPDLTVGPVLALDPEHVSGPDRDHGRDVGMPAVVANLGLLVEGLRQVHLKHGLHHRTHLVPRSSAGFGRGSRWQGLEPRLRPLLQGAAEALGRSQPHYLGPGRPRPAACALQPWASGWHLAAHDLWLMPTSLLTLQSPTHRRLETPQVRRGEHPLSCGAASRAAGGLGSPNERATLLKGSTARAGELVQGHTRPPGQPTGTTRELPRHRRGIPAAAGTRRAQGGASRAHAALTVTIPQPSIR